MIHGQNHKGSTYHITEKLKNALADENTVTHEFFMPKDALDYCIGCFSCFTKGENYCPQYEKVNRIV